jgi:glycine reductase
MNALLGSNLDVRSDERLQKEFDRVVAGVNDLTAQGWQSVHGGYDTTNANADPNRVLPIDVVREFEREGVIGQLHDEYFMTVGSGMSTDDARRFAGEMAEELRDAEVDAVIFTAT